MSLVNRGALSDKGFWALWDTWECSRCTWVWNLRRDLKPGPPMHECEPVQTSIFDIQVR